MKIPTSRDEFLPESRTVMDHASPKLQNSDLKFYFDSELSQEKNDQTQTHLNE